MNKKITEIVKGMRSLACAIVALVATSAALPLMADGLAITPTEIPAATQQVYYAQTFTASGASGGLSWSTVAWKVESAASTYAVGASETPRSKAISAPVGGVVAAMSIQARTVCSMHSSITPAAPPRLVFSVLPTRSSTRRSSG